MKKNKLFCILISLFSILNYSLTNAQCSLLCNTDFEANQIAGSTVTIQDTSFIPCWGTTAPDNKIEVWANGYNGVPSYSGNQFIELNAYYVSTLFQNFSAVPNASLTVSFAHRGRAGIDSMSVEVGPIGGLYTSLGIYGDDANAWGYYTVGYTVPASAVGNFTLRFNSIYATGGNQAIGNFLDAISVNLPSNSTLSLTSTPVSCSGLSDGSSQVTVSGGSVPFTYTWSPSGGNTANATNLSSGTYTVFVKDANGCIATEKIDVIKNPTDNLELKLPNVFTPNKDGVNDELDFYLINNCGTYELTIYNRWGLKLFYTSDLKTKNWDGKNLSGEDATDGLYFYILEGESKKYNGTITLFR